MRRRVFLKTSGIALIALQTGLLTACKQDDQAAPETVVDSENARQALDALAKNLDGVSFAGPVCLAQAEMDHPTDDPLAKLLSRLRSSEALPLEAALAALISSDMAAGRIVSIEGWQLAESECLLLAGAARLQGLQSASRAEAGALVFEDFAEVELWGPSETIEGEIFNPIGNGRGGFWIRVANPVPAASRLVLDGVELATHFEPGVVTASLEPDYMTRIISEPGMHELILIDKTSNRAQRIGYLKVRQRPPMATLADGSVSRVFCQVEGWGPDQANQGQAFNEQPDGSAAFWVRIGCAPNAAWLTLDGTRLQTMVRPGLVTARLPGYDELVAGDYRLELHDPDSNETLAVGIFRLM